MPRFDNNQRENAPALGGADVIATNNENTEPK